MHSPSYVDVLFRFLYQSMLECILKLTDTLASASEDGQV